MYAKAVIPNARSLEAYLVYSVQLLPDGCRGFLLTTLVATILSTLDSFLIISSSILSYDASLFETRNHRLKHALGLVITGIITVVVALS